jgi:hypothetical protein
MSHKLAYKYEGELLTATCRCGQWTQALNVPKGARPSAFVEQLEQAFDRHVLESGANPHQGRSNSG